MNAHLALPPITIHLDDYNALVLSAELARRANRPHAGFLIAELRRARLCERYELPRNVVSMGCSVTYRLTSSAAKATRRLVFEYERAKYANGLSVATPLGTALLGVRVGDRMPFRLGYSLEYGVTDAQPALMCVLFNACNIVEQDALQTRRPLAVTPLP